MNFTKCRVPINAEACRLNLGEAVRPDSSTTGFRSMCITLSFSFETQRDLERQVYLTFSVELACTVAGWSSLDRGQSASPWDYWEGCEDSAVM